MAQLYSSVYATTGFSPDSAFLFVHHFYTILPSLAIGIVKLVVEPEENATHRARQIIQQTRQEVALVWTIALDISEN